MFIFPGNEMKRLDKKETNVDKDKLHSYISIKMEYHHSPKWKYVRKWLGLFWK